MQYFVGLDWAAREHAVCVVDGRGAVVAQFTVAHTATGWPTSRHGSARWHPLPSCASPSSGRLAWSWTPSSRASSPSWPIHPNVVKSARPRYSAAQGKTDLGDAYLLADLLRTDGHRFRTLVPLSDETKALRGL